MHRDKPPRDNKVGWACYRKSDNTVMVNANGKDPATLGKYRYGRASMGTGCPPFWLDQRTAWWVIKKLQFNWMSPGIHLCADNCVVEDCFFYKCYRVAIFICGRTDVVQRCNFYRCGGGLVGGGTAHMLDNNMIIECDVAPDEDVMIGFTPEQEDYNWESGCGPTCFKGNNLAMTFSYNIVSDNKGTGWYADIDAKSCRILGNAFWDNGGGAIYNEYAVDDTTVIGNAFYRCGVAAAMCMRLNVVENYFFQSGLSWCSREWWMLRDSYMLSRKNVFNNPTYGYLLNYGKPFTQEGFANSISDFNRIYQAGDAVLLWDTGTEKNYRTLDEIRKVYGFETHGDVKPYRGQSADEAIGRWAARGHIPRALGQAQPRSAADALQRRFRVPLAGRPGDENRLRVPAFFWRVADGNYDAMPLSGTMDPRQAYLSRWQPTSMEGYRDKGNTAGCRWYVEADLKFAPRSRRKSRRQRSFLVADQRHAQPGQPLRWRRRGGAGEDSAPRRGILDAVPRGRTASRPPFP